MKKINAEADLSDEDREHLTLYMYNHPEAFSIYKIQPKSSWQSTGHSFTIDTEDDYQFAKKLLANINGSNFSIDELIEVSKRDF